MKWQLKLRDDASDAERDRVTLLAHALGATRVEALFPGHEVPALRGLLLVEAPDAANAQSLRARLESDESVQYVEDAVDRRLAREDD
jgi:predicted alpha/beta hydrolase family esterase